MELLIEIPPTIPVRHLGALRTKEERRHSELVAKVAFELKNANSLSVHHGWIWEASDFLEMRSSNWRDYGSQGRTLLYYLDTLHREGSSLFAQEEETIRSLAAEFREYALALKAVHTLESRTLQRVKSYAPSA